MTELAVIEFTDNFKADAFIFALKELEDACDMELEDTVLISKNDGGEVRVDQTLDAFAQFFMGGGLYFGFVGGVLGWIFTHDLFSGVIFGAQAGVLFGFVAGVLTGITSGVGVSKRLIRETSAALAPGTAAAIVLSRTPLAGEKVLAAISQFDGTVVSTTLPADEEAKLASALA